MVSFYKKKSALGSFWFILNEFPRMALGPPGGFCLRGDMCRVVSGIGGDMSRVALVFGCGGDMCRVALALGGTCAEWLLALGVTHFSVNVWQFETMFCQF